MKANAANADEYTAENPYYIDFLAEIDDDKAEQVMAEKERVQELLGSGEAEYYYVRMQGDLILEEPLLFYGASNVVWDLNGHTIDVPYIAFWDTKSMEFTDAVGGGLVTSDHLYDGGDCVGWLGAMINTFNTGKLIISGGTYQAKGNLDTIMALVGNIEITGGVLTAENPLHDAVVGLADGSPMGFIEAGDIKISGGEINGNIKMLVVGEDEGGVVFEPTIENDVALIITGGTVNGQVSGFKTENIEIPDEGYTLDEEGNITTNPSTDDDNNDDNTGDDNNDNNTPSTPSTDGNKAPSTDEPTENKMFIMLLIGGGAALALVLVGIAIAMLCKRRKK